MFSPFELFKMLHKCCSNTTLCGKHLCSKLVYLKDHIFWATVLFPENQAPVTRSYIPLCTSGPTAVSTSTVWLSDPVGAAELCRAFLWTALVALSSFSQSVGSIIRYLSSRQFWEPMCGSFQEGMRWHFPTNEYGPPLKVQSPSPYPISSYYTLRHL